MNKLIPFIMISVLTLTSCATSKHEVKEIDNEIVSKGQVQDKTLGLDEDDKVILQKETFADEELRLQIWKNSELEDRLSHEVHMLKWCRKDMADTRLGGSGEVEPLPEVDEMKDPVKVKEEFGLVGDNEDLKFVKREMFLDRLESERKYSSSLKSMVKTVSDHRERCEMRMGTARVRVGLPAERFEGKVELTDEGAIQKVVQRNENNLDDAFEIKKQK